jgi:predicted Ser/Thr protein kinase
VVDETELGSAFGSQATGTRQEPVKRLRRGEVVGRYVIVEQLGAGGMGVVYAAYDPELDRRVALKLLNPRGHASGSSKGRARLVREAQALAQLNHTNVVTVHDVGEHDGRVFVAMEYIEGTTLKLWFRSTPRPWREVVQVFLLAARGLMAAHAKEMTHRDFKPDNVMLQGDGANRRVVVMDFGLASAPTSAQSGVDFDPSASASLASTVDLDALTQTGAVMGTPSYMAPEQHAGHSSPHSDQFSFCVTLYEALYGRRPFRGTTLPELVGAVSSGDIEPPPSPTKVPGWLRDVVVRGLAADPDKRWPSMSALVQALQADPSRRRWALTGVVALVATAGTALVLDTLSDRRLAKACAEERMAIEQTWGEAQRKAAADAFGASELSYASAVWANAESRLDDVTQAWADARGQSCLTRSQLPHSLREVQDACFESRRRRLEKNIKALSSPESARPS